MTFPAPSSAHHDIWRCKHGTVVRQCRCPQQPKEIRIVSCPIWCKEKDERQEQDVE